MSKSTKQIVENLKPTHLIDTSPEEIKKEILEKEKEEEEDQETKKINGDLKMNEVYPFDLQWVSPKGKVWKGHFVNRILNIRDQQNVGLMRAKLSGGIPYESLDPLTKELNLMLAHLTFSLDERPDWAADLTKLDSVELLQAIYGEVASHEATFRGYN